MTSDAPRKVRKRSWPKKRWKPGERVIEPQKNKPENQPTLTERKCLSCNQLFNSHGIQNRICEYCKTQDFWKDPEL